MQNTVPDSSRASFQVAVGIIEQHDTVLIAKRSEQQTHAGLWEFPGGKQKISETPYQALVRELQEELDIFVQAARPKITVQHDYEGYRVKLNVYQITQWSGEAKGIEGQKIKWVKKSDLHKFTFMTANKTILKSILLPDIYCITPDTRNMSDHDVLAKIDNLISQGISIFQFRDKYKPLNDSKELIQNLFKLCDDASACLLLNGHPDDLKNHLAHGLHLSSKYLGEFSQRPIAENTLLSVSCHNDQELDLAQKIDADMVLLGSVMNTSTHLDIEGFGWEHFQQLCQHTNIPVYSLGGMQRTDLETCWRYGAQGLAMISGLWD